MCSVYGVRLKQGLSCRVLHTHYRKKWCIFSLQDAVMLIFLRRFLNFMLALSCSALAQAEDSLQVGFMYAEKIRGVGLYAGLEKQDLFAQASGYIDLALLVSDAYDAEQPIFGGLSLGLRTTLAETLSPYIGAGVYVGKNEKEVSASQDKIDNNNNGFTDEIEETTLDEQYIAAIYPELGWRLALGESVSIRMLGRYMISSSGREHDDWFYGLSLAFSHE